MRYNDDITRHTPQRYRCGVVAVHQSRAATRQL